VSPVSPPPSVDDAGPPGQGLPRRRLLAGSMGMLGVASVAGCTRAAVSGSGPAAAAPADAGTVRLSSVTTVRDGGLYDVLLPEFEARSGYRVALAVAEDVYGPARAGRADIVFSHFGHPDVDTFVQAGLGQWPRPVLFNQVCVIGPTTDPAQVANVADLVAVFQRIARSGAPFVVNDIEGLRYLSHAIAIDAGLSITGGMFLDEGLRQGPAIDRAAARGGYTMWGLTPFQRYAAGKPLPLRPLVLADPALQRIMVTVVVDPTKVAGVNLTGATALQNYLLTPETQAKIRAFRTPGIDQPVFWPAGRNNLTSFLPAAPGPARPPAGNGNGQGGGNGQDGGGGNRPGGGGGGGGQGGGGGGGGG